MLKRMTVVGMAVASVAAALSTPVPTFGATTGEYKISIEMINGSGCSTRESVAAMFTEDKKAFTLTYNAFETRGGSSNNCQLGLRLHVPEGETYAITTVDSRGDGYILAGGSGRHTITAYFTGRTTQLNSKYDIQGPFDDVWETRNVWPERDWAPCEQDRLLNINDVIRVTGTTENYMNMFSTDVKISAVYNIETKPCS